MMESFIERIRSGGKIRYLATAAVVVLLALLAIVIRNTASGRVYTSYKVERAIEKTDNVSRYEYADGSVLRYSIDGAALIDRKLETVWTASYSMTDPRADVMRNRIVIYDRLGTDIRLFDHKSETGRITAEHPVLLARVSAKSTVAVLMSDGQKTAFAYYNSAGQKIADGECSMSNPGYPVTLALSPDGKTMAISYVSVAGGLGSSIVRYYYFGGNEGGGADSMSAEFTFEGLIAPDVRFLSSRESVIFMEDGFTCIKGNKSPEEGRTVKYNKDICSVFTGDSKIGVVTESGVPEHKYSMDLFRADGRELSSGYVDVLYDRIRPYSKSVIFSSGTEFGVYGYDGSEKFKGRLVEGNIADAMKLGRNRILVLTDRRMEVISLR